MEITNEGQEESAVSSSSNTWHKVQSFSKCGGDQQGNKFLVLFNVFGYDSKSTKVNYYFNRLWNSCFV